MERIKFDKSKVNLGNSVQEKKDNISKQIQVIRHEASQEVQERLKKDDYTLTDYATALDVDISAVHNMKSGKREFAGNLQTLLIMCKRFLKKSPQQLLFGEDWELEIPKVLSSFLIKYKTLKTPDKEEIDKLFEELPKQPDIDPAELSYYRLRERCASEGKLLRGEYTEPYTTAIKTSYMLWIDNKQFMGNYSSLMFFCAVLNMPVDYFVCIDYSNNPLIYYDGDIKKTVQKKDKKLIQKYLTLSWKSQTEIAGELFTKVI